MSALQVRLLGPFELAWDGEPLVITGIKPKAVLAILALNAGRVLSIDHLIDSIWGVTPPQTAANAVQVYISGLRRMIGAASQLPDDGFIRGLIKNTASGYVLNLSPDDVDVSRFVKLADEGRRHLNESRPELAAEALSAALQLWRGEALADFSRQSFVDVHRAQLEARRIEAVVDRIDALLALGRTNEVMGELRHLVKQYPTHERMTGLLMLALYRSGQQSDALKAYAQIRDGLIEEMGLDVGPDLGALYERILRQDPELNADELYIEQHPDFWSQPDGAPRQTRTSELPNPFTSLIGREREIDAAIEGLSIRRHRLVTLLGPGGTGKTRVALEVGHRLRDHFSDGVVFVGLAAVAHETEMLPQLQRALAVPDEPGQSTLETVIHHLRNREVLIIFDNFEHVIGAAVNLAALLEGSLGVTILVTSREALRISGETALQIPPLSLPRPSSGTSNQADYCEIKDSEAVQLFIERASAASGLELTDSNAATIAAICERLDGVPLALELAAARSALLSPEMMLPRLEQSLGLLTSGPRDLPARQRSLRATLDWSWALLSPPEIKLLESLAWFPGGWTIETAEAIFQPGQDDVLETLARLVDKNMMTTDRTGRFNLLRVVREYVVARLQSHVEPDRYPRMLVSWAVKTAAELHQQYQALGYTSAIMARFHSESANLLGALDVVEQQRDADTLADLVAHVGLFICSSGRSGQARRWLNAALDVASSPGQRADLLRLIGVNAFIADGDAVASERRQREALTLYEQQGDLNMILRTRYNIAHTLRWQGRMTEALSSYEALTRDAEEAGWSGLKLATLRAELGEMYDEFGEETRAQRLAQEYLEAAEAAADSDGRAYGTAELALVSLSHDHQLAQAFVMQSSELAAQQEVGLTTRADVLEMLGIAEIAMGRMGDAESRLLEAATLMLDSGYRLPLADTVSALGICASLTGRPEDGAALCGAAADIRQRAGLGMVYRQLRAEYCDALNHIHSALPAETVQQEWNSGQSVSRSTSGLRGLLQTRSESGELQATP